MRKIIQLAALLFVAVAGCKKSEQPVVSPLLSKTDVEQAFLKNSHMA